MALPFISISLPPSRTIFTYLFSISRGLSARRRLIASDSHCRNIFASPESLRDVCQRVRLRRLPCRRIYFRQIEFHISRKRAGRARPPSSSLILLMIYYIFICCVLPSPPVLFMRFFRPVTTRYAPLFSKNALSRGVLSVPQDNIYCAGTALASPPRSALMIHYAPRISTVISSISALRRAC